MLTLTGTLRQFGEVKFGDGSKEKPFKEYLKLWIEHETPRHEGPDDLRIEEMLIPLELVGPEAKTLKKGAETSVIVRTYAKGRDVVFQAVSLVGAVLTPEANSNAVGVK